MEVKNNETKAYGLFNIKLWLSRQVLASSLQKKKFAQRQIGKYIGLFYWTDSCQTIIFFKFNPVQKSMKVQIGYCICQPPNSGWTFYTKVDINIALNMLYRLHTTKGTRQAFK